MIYAATVPIACPNLHFRLDGLLTGTEFYNLHFERMKKTSNAAMPTCLSSYGFLMCNVLEAFCPSVL